MPKPHLPQLTGLRILAALWVVFFHMALPGGWLHGFVGSAPQWIANLMLTGHCGVGLFFVLSGFILAYTYLNEDGQVDRRSFWLNRFARVYPVYLLSLIVVLPLNWEQLGGSGSVKFGMVAGLIQAWFPRFALHWNGPAWSLSAEAFFYAVFPFILPYLVRLKRPKLGILGCVVVSAVVVVACLFVSPELRGVRAIDDPSGLLLNILRFNPLVRLPEFVMGICFAILLSKAPPKLHPLVPATLLLVFIMAGAHVVPRFAFAAVLAPLFGLLIVCLASRGQVLLSTPLMVKGGEISYAVYLLHVPIAHYFQGFASGTAIWLVPSYLVVTFLVAWAAFELVEEPCRKFIRRTAGRKN